MIGDKTLHTAPPRKSNNTSSFYLIKRLLSTYLAPYTKSLVLALIFMVIASAMTAAIALLLQPVLDEVLPGGDTKKIMTICAAVFATFVTRGLSMYLYTIIMNKIGQSIIADVQNDLFARFMKLDLAFFHAHPSGELISRIISDVSILRTAVSDSLLGLGKSLLTLFFLIGVMFYQDPKLATAALIIFPLAAGFVAHIGRRLRKVSRNIQSEMASLSSILSEIFKGIRQVKAFGTETYEKRRAGTAIETVKKLNIKSVRIGNLATPMNEFLIGIVAAAIIFYGGHEVAAGHLTPGSLVSFLGAFTMAYEPMKKLARLNNIMQTGLGAAERVFDMLDSSGSIKNNPGAKGLKAKKPEIKFENVEFSYESKNIKALNDISFTAKAGKVTALVGPSGGGKSTIINLIPRFYDISSGSITIGEKNIQDVTITSLRSHIALVSQDITIFDDTLAANIAYGKPGAKEGEIIKAAKAAAAHNFIIGFEQGYQTRVGEHGVKLSGGQRQRIAIARAILRDAPILLLDEATSALDNESEKAVQAALKKLEKGRTTIVIAHRLSTVHNADQIIVLDQGKIVEKGKHASLVKKKGLYSQMHKAGLEE